MDGRRRAPVVTTQLAIIVALLLLWQLLPQIEALREATRFLDPYFISAPTRIGVALLGLITGTGDNGAIWPHLWPTLTASVLGTAIGMILGGAIGLALSNYAFLSQVFRPFIAAINAIPRIALIPIVILLFGPTFTSAIVVSVLVVFFIAFHSAYEGGSHVAPEIVHNASLLGATRWELMRHIRLPIVLAWTIAVLPLGATFAIISVVTAEILMGSVGIGRLLTISTQTANSTLTFALVVILAVMGLSVVHLTDAAKRRILHWWET